MGLGGYEVQDLRHSFCANVVLKDNAVDLVAGENVADLGQEGAGVGVVHDHRDGVDLQRHVQEALGSQAAADVERVRRAPEHHRDVDHWLLGTRQQDVHYDRGTAQHHGQHQSVRHNSAHVHCRVSADPKPTESMGDRESRGACLPCINQPGKGGVEDALRGALAQPSRPSFLVLKCGGLKHPTGVPHCLFTAVEVCGAGGASGWTFSLSSILPPWWRHYPSRSKPSSGWAEQAVERAQLPPS